MTFSENTKSLERFVEAQKETYASSLKEIRLGRKTGHWMWYVFPQIHGLGHSETAKFYAITGKPEAQRYLSHEILGPRLIGISKALLQLETSDPVTVFGSIDSLKLKSSMTLFSLAEPTDPVFSEVLEKFFHGKRDEKTVKLLDS